MIWLSIQFSSKTAKILVKRLTHCKGHHNKGNGKQKKSKSLIDVEKPAKL
jgi:hypothetical protein